ncbi:hypothetical protein B0H11DRAFT_2020910 [Mycena galericulata]|nr:hypothetical protein B0H11DRAFT_2020910 [Mycena galericulata]
MLARTLVLPILLFSTLIAASGRFHAVLRQTDSDCSNECAAYDNDPGVCNNTIVNDEATCLNCQIKTGSMTQQDAQDVLNSFVQNCLADETPVTSISLSGNSPTSAGSAPAPLSTSTPASPTQTTKPAKGPTTTEPPNDQTTTDSAGDPVSASGNSTDSASAPSSSGPTGAAMKTQSAAGITSVLIIVSVFVTLG